MGGGPTILDLDLRSQPLRGCTPTTTLTPEAASTFGNTGKHRPDPDLGPPQSTKKEPQFPAALSALIH